MYDRRECLDRLESAADDQHHTGENGNAVSKRAPTTLGLRHRLPAFRIVELSMQRSGMLCTRCPTADHAECVNWLTTR